MKHIIFPTDFSKESLNAFDYALAYAKSIASGMIVFHAYSGEITTMSDDNLEVYDAADVINFRKNKDVFAPFERMQQERESDVQIQYHVVEGNFMDSFRTFLTEKKDEVSAVVMGTDNNKDTFKEFFISPNTIKVMEMVNKPLLAVPEKATFDGKLDNIMFLVDYREDEKAPIADLIAKTKRFNARLHVVHIDLANTDDLTHKMDAFKASIQNNDFDNVTFESLVGLDINEAVGTYCKTNNIDIVYLMNHQMNFFRRLFTQNIAEELIKRLDTPVMAVYKK